MDANKIQAYINARQSGQTTTQAAQTAANTKEYKYNPLASSVAPSGKSSSTSAKSNPFTTQYNRTVNDLNAKNVTVAKNDNEEKKSWLGEVGKASAKGSGSGFLNALTTFANLIGKSQQQQITPGSVMVQATTDILSGDKSGTSAIEKVSTRNESVNSDENLGATFKPMYEKADTMQAESAQHTQNAKDAAGNTKLGNIATDVAVNAGQMAIEAPLNFITPGASLFGMGIRSFGSASQEARQAGADQLQQFAYGTVKAGTEVATEKMFDGLMGLYGKGAFDDVVDSFIEATAKGSALKKTLLTLALSPGEEAVEEAVSSVADPFAKAIYDNGEELKYSALTPEGRREWIKNIGYDALIGGILGGFGGAGKVVKANINAARTVENTVDTTNDPTALEKILGNNSRYSKAASEILNNAEALAEYEKNFGEIEGNSETEKIRNLAAALYLTTTKANTATNTTETTQAIPETLEGANNPMAMPNGEMSLSPTDSYVRGLIMNGEAEEILSSEDNITAYEKLTGEKLPSNKEKAYQQIMARSRNTFSGETDLSNNAITDNFNTAESTAMYDGDGNVVLDGNKNTQNINAETTQAETQQITPQSEQNATEVVKPQENPTQAATTPNNSQTNTLTRNQTATSPVNEADFGNDQAVTQDTIIQSNLNSAEYDAVGGDTTHTVHHDVDVDAYARSRIESDPDAARNDLLGKKDYDDIDVATSNMIIAEDVAKAREYIQNGETEKATEMWEKIAEIRAAREKGLTKIAEAMRQAGRLKSTFTNVTDDIISDATTQLYGKDAQLRNGVTDVDKVNLINEITAYTNRLESAIKGTADETIQLIMDVSATRKTTNLLGSTDFGLIENALRKISGFKNGKDFLDNLATTQIKSIAGDYNKPGFIDSVKAIRYMFALSNPKTANTNVGANTLFGSVISTTSNDVGCIFDAIMSIFTGKRTLAFDRSLLSADTWQGANEGMLKSFVEVALDAEADQATYAYNEIKGTHFKMTGNWLERFLATCEKYQGFALKTTDQLAKGGIEAETMRGLNNIRNGEMTEAEMNEIAQEEAKYRTLQTNTKVSQSLSEVKNWLNKKFHIGNSKTGTIGIGDHFIMFAQVPANQVVTQLQLQPALSSIDALGNVAKMFVEAKNGGKVSNITQRKAAVSFGRMINGFGLVAGAYALTAMGCIRCVDEDDDDLAMMLKAQGKTGTQWNISATARLVTGGDTTTQEGDTWVALNWIPQLNSMVITGSSIYNSKLDDGSIDAVDVVYAMGKGLVDSLKDFPAVSGITSTIKAWDYAKYEGEDRDEMTDEEKAVADTKAKAGAVLGNEIGNAITSMSVPAIVRSIASGTDDTERNTFRSNNPLVRAGDVWKSGIPGLRQTVSPKIDNFGNEVKNEGGLQQFANKVLLPGAVTHDRTTEAQAFTEEMARKLDDASIVPNRNSPTVVSVKINGNTSNARLTEEERATWQTTYGTAAEALYLKAKNSAEFNALPDDEQKAVLKDLLSVANGLASAEFKQSRGAEYENDIYRLLNKYNKKGDDFTPLGTNNIVSYYCNKVSFENAIKNDDYDTIDTITSAYNDMNTNLKDVLSERVEGINPYIKAAKAGVSAESWSIAKDALGAVQREEDTESDGSRLKYKALIQSGLPVSEQQKLIDMEDEISQNWKMADKVLTEEGFTKQQIYDFFSNADWTYSEKTDEYKANGQLGAYEAYVALLNTIPDDESKRRRIFNAFVEATGEAGRYDGWSRNLKGVNKWAKYDYDYVKRVVNNYGGKSYGAWNDSNSQVYNALTDTKPKETGINSDLNQWIMKNF